MIAENENVEDKEICNFCESWNLMGVHPSAQTAMGSCCNQEHEEAPFGVMTANFGGCAGFKKKEVSKIAVPTSKLSRL